MGDSGNCSDARLEHLGNFVCRGGALQQLLIHSSDKIAAILKGRIALEFSRFHEGGIDGLASASARRCKVDDEPWGIVFSTQHGAVPGGAGVRAGAVLQQADYKSKRKRSSGMSTTGLMGRGELMPGISEVDRRCRGAPSQAAMMNRNNATARRMLRNLGKGSDSDRGGACFLQI